MIEFCWELIQFVFCKNWYQLPYDILAICWRYVPTTQVLRSIIDFENSMSSNGDVVEIVEWWIDEEKKDTAGSISQISKIDSSYVYSKK